MEKNITLVLFGGTGDLAKKKILPALNNLLEREGIHRLNLVVTGRRQMSPEEYRKHMEYEHHHKISLNYLQMDFENADAEPLKHLLSKIEDESVQGRIFYFAISPKYFSSVAKSLASITKDKTKFNRLMFEKPFGHDLKTSRQLARILSKYFDEKDIYRVDHYLGKETVKNILALRLANPIFEKTWNHEFIDSITITVSENMGVGNRIEYYDSSGAIRDLIQNHMLQILSFVLMDSPKGTDSGEIHREKTLAFKKLRNKRTITGQYEGYLNELAESGLPASNTETYALLELSSTSKRWKNTKIYLITGKHMEKRFAKIEIDYKKEPCKIFCDEKTPPNKLVINVQPKQDVDFHLNAPYGEAGVKNVKMTFCKECEFSSNTPENYEILIDDCIKGEKTLFITGSELEYAWKLVDRIRLNLPEKPIIYGKGSDIMNIQ